MPAHIKWIFGILVCLPSPALATITVHAGDWLLQPNTPGQHIYITMTRTGNEEIAIVDLYLRINGGVGPAPFVTAIDMVGPGTLFSAAPSLESLYPDPWDVANGVSTGLEPAKAAYCTTLAGPDADVPAEGILAKVTVSTVDVPPGLYDVSLTSLDLGSSLLHQPHYNYLELNSDYFLVDGSLIVAVPEPPSIAMLLTAVATAAAVTWRGRSRRVRITRS